MYEGLDDTPLTEFEPFECPANGWGDVIRWKQRAELLIGHVDHLWDYISVILEKGVDYDFGPDPSDVSERRRISRDKSFNYCPSSRTLQKMGERS